MTVWLWWCFDLADFEFIDNEKSKDLDGAAEQNNTPEQKPDIRRSKRPKKYETCKILIIFVQMLMRLLLIILSFKNFRVHGIHVVSSYFYPRF